MIKGLSRSREELQKNLARLASGETQLGDDAAGLAISERLRSLIESYEASSRNVSDGRSLVRTADAALGEVGDAAGRLRELAVQSANDTLSDADRTAIQEEVDQLRSEIDRIAGSTNHNGVNLLDGTQSEVTLQAGPEEGDTVSVDLAGVSSADLGLDGLDVSQPGGGSAALADIDAAIAYIAEVRGGLGAADNRLGSLEHALGEAHDSLVRTESRIRDVDVAEETADRMPSLFKQHAGAALLVQGNVENQVALKLLGG